MSSPTPTSTPTAAMCTSTSESCPCCINERCMDSGACTTTVNWFMYIAIIVGIVSFGVVAFQIRRKRKRRQAQLDQVEESRRRVAAAHGLPDPSMPPPPMQGGHGYMPNNGYPGPGPYPPPPPYQQQPNGYVYPNSPYMVDYKQNNNDNNDRNGSNWDTESDAGSVNFDARSDISRQSNQQWSDNDTHSEIVHGVPDEFLDKH